MAIVLAVATEWASGHGGISTFNRELCIAWAKAIPDDEVFCLVPASVRSADIEEAKQQGVSLVRARTIPGRDANHGLSSPARLPDGKRPDIIIGHGRHTGPDAFAQHGSFPDAIRVHFFHVAPEEIEYFKDQNPRESAAQKGEERTFVELDLCKPEPGDSSPRVVAVAVGPRLRKVYERELHAEGLSVHEFIPGFLDKKDNPNRPQHPRILMLGRGEDKKLKGLDIAARAFGKLDRAFIKGDIELLVRGAPAHEADALKAELCALADCNANDIRVRTYSSDADRISKEILNSSVVVMPSRVEGFGLVGLEAISKNVPVLVSNQSGLGEFLHAKAPEEAHLCVVPVSNNEEQTVNTWAKRIEQALGNPKAAFTHAKELREALEDHCHWEKSVQELARLCQDRKTALPLVPVGASSGLGASIATPTTIEETQPPPPPTPEPTPPVVLTGLEELGLSLAQLCQMLQGAGAAHEKQYELEQALACYQKALQIEEKLSGDASLTVAAIHQKLGGVYRLAGQYKTSREHEEKALEIRQESHGPDHEEVASSLLSLAKTLEKLGLYQEGLDQANKALGIYHKLYGHKHADVANANAVESSLLYRLGVYELARTKADQSLVIRRELLGENNLDTAHSYELVGWAYLGQGKYEKAKWSFEKAFSIIKIHRGENHPESALSYCSVGIAYGMLGEYRKALSYEEKALEVLEKTLGKGHLDTATVYRSIGVEYSKLSEHDKALENGNRALKIRIDMLGEDHPDVANSYRNIGVANKFLKNYEMAKANVKMAIMSQERMLKEDHPSLALSYGELGSICLHISEIKDAFENINKSFEIQRRVLGEQHPDMIQTFNDLNILYSAKVEYKKAIEYGEQALKIQKRVLGEKHIDNVYIYENLIATYLLDGNIEKVLEYELKVVDIVEINLERQNSKLELCYENVAMTYEKLGETNKAQEYRDKAAAIRKKLSS